MRTAAALFLGNSSQMRSTSLGTLYWMIVVEPSFGSLFSLAQVNALLFRMVWLLGIATVASHMG
ncbi:hypothetical protein Tdes44962_MAKER02760 [Teratosphaeria destructans]|uniref:Uncharacterized protein n=1 Tax=Teratosphaeria destructans TaxID=418781 RepID=A0A9W7W2L7_9PEZI|nr:hypothetical protein Tdes44962_MAKER02760 [Teratosphaeria destructans]